MYNRLTWPKKMAEFLSDHNINPILIDNNSTYVPLLKWYENCKYKVYRLNENLGHKALYKSGILNEYNDRYYILTDHDLDISNIPPDFLDKLFTGIKSEKYITKCGLSLEIDDLPKNKYTQDVINWESNYWNRPFDSLGNYISEVDTTFALYDRNREFDNFPNGDDFFKATRTPKPYLAKHLPWYNTPENIDEEENYYIKSTQTYWLSKYKEIFNS